MRVSSADFKIRHYRSADADSIVQIFHASVHGLANSDYTSAQLKAWSPSPRDADWYRTRAQNRTIWVAERADTLIGFAELESNGHVDMVYVAPSVARQGVATALLHALESHAREAGLPGLFVEASETALPFFTRVGFGSARRREIERDGVRLHNYAMEKALA